MDTGYEKLINDLVKLGYLKTPEIINAFRKFPRRYFVPISLSQFANENRPLPIGSGQTISQPLTVAFMIEVLEPCKGQKILEIGSGSGWQTAMLSDIVGDEGRIYACEIVESLIRFGKKNLERFELKNIILEHKDISQKYTGKILFDRIISAAAFSEIPGTLKKQLVVGGILVAPTQKDDIHKIRRISTNGFTEEIVPGFSFVPIVTREF